MLRVVIDWFHKYSLIMYYIKEVKLNFPSPSQCRLNSIPFQERWARFFHLNCSYNWLTCFPQLKSASCMFGICRITAKGLGLNLQECSQSRQTPEAQQPWAWRVLGWVDHSTCRVVLGSFVSTWVPKQHIHCSIMVWSCDHPVHLHWPARWSMVN